MQMNWYCWIAFGVRVSERAREISSILIATARYFVVFRDVHFYSIIMDISLLLIGGIHVRFWLNKTIKRILWVQLIILMRTTHTHSICVRWIIICLICHSVEFYPPNREFVLDFRSLGIDFFTWNYVNPNTLDVLHRTYKKYQII